ncbi:MAG: amidohydrolase family protein [Myxococcales bacterium]|nr:amidohydrolase family protein [Myxococcales bacterium]MCB9737494.1 amidohydrolase family protein [Deltaproteobacteria bacterium]
MYDLLIRGGRVVDGTGAPARTADVAITGDRIAAVGRITAPARDVMNADGLLITPGFVDLHTHYDAQVTWDPYLTPSSWHGCTTVVMGNCGVGFAPAAPDKHKWLIELMEGVEDIPGTAMHEGIQWEWETFPEYLDAIARKAHVIDFGAQVPHGPLRAYVMGERGAANEDATDADVARMAALVREGMVAGALGFSTSRTMLHKAIDGRPVPGTFANQRELFGIGRVLGELGAGVFQTATDHLNVPDELKMFEQLANEIGRPVLFNLSQTDAAPGLWREVLAELERINARGGQVFGQVAGRAIGVLMSFRTTGHPFVAYPSWIQMMGQPWEVQRAKLLDPAFKAKLLSEKRVDLRQFAAMVSRAYDWDFVDFLTTSFDKMYPHGSGIEYEPRESESVAAIAAATGKRPEEVAYDALAANGGEGMLYFPLFNYADKDLELLRELHAHPSTRMGLSDAGAHCGAVCDGGMPTFMLTHWTRDRTRGDRLPLEHIVRRQTMDTARTYGLLDRGVLAPGYLADVNLIDYDNLRFMEPGIAFDLPSNARRLVQRATGYVATVKRGEVILKDGKPTGALPGQLIRGAQAAPKD